MHVCAAPPLGTWKQKNSSIPIKFKTWKNTFLCIIMFKVNSKLCFLHFCARAPRVYFARGQRLYIFQRSKQCNWAILAPKIWISDFVMIFFGHVVVYVLFSNLFGSGIFKPSCVKFKKIGGNIAQLLCFDLYKNKISRQIDSSFQK